MNRPQPKDPSTTALLICNGGPVSSELLATWAKSGSYMVAADGGANELCRAGYCPHVVIGDFDSMTSQTRGQLTKAQFICVPNQEKSDFEKAMEHLATTIYTHVIIVGAWGQRVDYSVAHLVLLWRYVTRFDLVLWTEDWCVYPVVREKRLHVPIGTRVSLIPLGPCQGLVAQGLQYQVNEMSVDVGWIGVSNAVIASDIVVKVESGPMLLMIETKG